MINKEKFEKDVKDYLATNLASEIQNEQNQNYIILLAKTYYTDETTEGKFAEYIEEIIDEKNVREPLINKIKSLKHQYNSTSNEQPQTQTIKVKQQPAKSVEERITSKPQKIESDDKSKKFHPKQKNKNGQEKVEGEPRKKVKKQEMDGQNKQGENKGQMIKAGLKKKLETEGKQKCKFFPFCKNEETCEFFHPTQKVHFFFFHLRSKQKMTPEIHIDNDQEKNQQKSSTIKIVVFMKGENLKTKKLASQMKFH